MTEPADDLFRLLCQQEREGRRRKETEPLRRWIAELEMSAAVARQVIVGELGAIPADAVRKAVRKFESQRGGWT